MKKHLLYILLCLIIFIMPVFKNTEVRAESTGTYDLPEGDIRPDDTGVRDFTKKYDRYLGSEVMSANGDLKNYGEEIAVIIFNRYDDDTLKKSESSENLAADFIQKGYATVVIYYIEGDDKIFIRSKNPVFKAQFLNDINSKFKKDDVSESLNKIIAETKTYIKNVKDTPPEKVTEIKKDPEIKKRMVLNTAAITLSVLSIIMAMNNNRRLKRTFKF